MAKLVQRVSLDVLLFLSTALNEVQGCKARQSLMSARAFLRVFVSAHIRDKVQSSLILTNYSEW